MGKGTQPVVVGYDGAAHSGQALHWAAAEAARRDAELVVVRAVDGSESLVGPSALARQRPSPWWPDPASSADRVAAAGADEATARQPGLVARVRSGRGRAADLLVEASTDAALVVLGSRGRGELARTFRGSVTGDVAARARCPVVIVRGDQPSGLPDRHHPVVVGLDGSAGGREALLFAAGLAGSTDATLHVVSVWDVTGVDAWVEFAGALGRGQLSGRHRDAAHAVVDAAVAEVAALHPALRVVGHRPRGDVAYGLTRTVRSAALLVTGTRGRAGLASLLLGSVGHTLVRTAPCPIAVVPPAVRTGDGAASGLPPRPTVGAGGGAG